MDLRLQTMDTHLAKNKYFLGDHYTVADMYALAILRTCEHVKVDLDKYPSVTIFKRMMEVKPLVVKLTKLEERDAQSL